MPRASSRPTYREEKIGRILGEVERLGEKIARPITLENGVEKVEDGQPLNLTWIVRSGRKNDRVVEAEKGEKERGDGGNYFRFRALGIGYTFSPRCLPRSSSPPPPPPLPSSSARTASLSLRDSSIRSRPNNPANLTIDRFSARFSTRRPPPPPRKRRKRSIFGAGEISFSFFSSRYVGREEARGI